MDLIYKVALALGQAAKDWPLATLLVVCGTALVAIPVAMFTKRILDMTWLNRDAYIAMQARHIAGLEQQVEQWKRTSEKANAGQRLLVEQVSALNTSAAELQTKLSNARRGEDNATRKMSDAEHRLLEATKLLDVRNQENQSLRQNIDGIENALMKIEEEMGFDYAIVGVNTLGMIEILYEHYKKSEEMQEWLTEAVRAKFFARVAKALNIGDVLGVLDGPNADLGGLLYRLFGALESDRE